MNKRVKRKIYNIYQEIAYLKDTVSKGCLTTRGYIKDAREQLMKYSPKPVGYYEPMINRQNKRGIDLSIIVPMYNCECYIRDCIASIMLQKTQFTYEILFIDDGSSDNTFNICRELSKEINAPTRIIQQCNRGAAGAKNRGLDEAVGEYVMFVDADDRIEENMIEKLMCEANKEKVDIVGCGFYTFDKNGITKEYKYPRVCVFNSTEEIMRKYPGYICMKVYKRTFWDKLRIPEGYAFEDMIVQFILSKRCRSFSYLPDALYAYRMHEQSTTSKSNSSIKSIDQYWLTEYIEDEYDKMDWSKDIVFYKAMIREMGKFLYNRTKNLPQYIRQAVFSCACDRVNKWQLKPQNFSRQEKRIINAFYNQDFAAWENASKYWR